MAQQASPTECSHAIYKNFISGSASAAVVADASFMTATRVHASG
jgi:hypothetical protein